MPRHQLGDAAQLFAYEQVDELTGILRLTTFDNVGRLPVVFCVSCHS